LPSLAMPDFAVSFAHQCRETVAADWKSFTMAGSSEEGPKQHHVHMENGGDDRCKGGMR